MSSLTSIHKYSTLFTHEEKTVLGFCGDSRYDGYAEGGFLQPLMEAFSKADTSNFKKLKVGFPFYAQAWERYRSGELSLRDKLAKAIAEYVVESNGDGPPTREQLEDLSYQVVTMLRRRRDAYSVNEAREAFQFSPEVERFLIGDNNRGPEAA